MTIEWKKQPRRGHIHHSWRGIVDDRVTFIVQKSRGHVYMDDLVANFRTEHASVEAAQEHAMAILQIVAADAEEASYDHFNRYIAGDR